MYIRWEKNRKLQIYSKRNGTEYYKSYAALVYAHLPSDQQPKFTYQKIYLNYKILPTSKFRSHTVKKQEKRRKQKNKRALAAAARRDFVPFNNSHSNRKIAYQLSCHICNENQQVVQPIWHVIYNKVLKDLAICNSLPPWSTEQHLTLLKDRCHFRMRNQQYQEVPRHQLIHFSYGSFSQSIISTVTQAVKTPRPPPVNLDEVNMDTLDLDLDSSFSGLITPPPTPYIYK